MNWLNFSIFLFVLDYVVGAVLKAKGKKRSCELELLPFYWCV